ncbi:hypothetical protein VKT23_019163 [Stygiomarasmius scandens]|uniref:Uncharacterized protein n=1 Tax=Marasmiellus scandens TaxID=2682957 RepID=A0ABR1IM65_9AGAR
MDISTPTATYASSTSTDANAGASYIEVEQRQIIDISSGVAVPVASASEDDQCSTPEKFGSVLDVGSVSESRSLVATDICEQTVSVEPILVHMEVFDIPENDADRDESVHVSAATSLLASSIGSVRESEPLLTTADVCEGTISMEPVTVHMEEFVIPGNNRDKDENVHFSAATSLHATSMESEGIRALSSNTNIPKRSYPSGTEDADMQHQDEIVTVSAIPVPASVSDCEHLLATADICEETFSTEPVIAHAKEFVIPGKAYFAEREDTNINYRSKIINVTSLSTSSVSESERLPTMNNREGTVLMEPVAIPMDDFDPSDNHSEVPILNEVSMTEQFDAASYPWEGVKMAEYSDDEKYTSDGESTASDMSSNQGKRKMEETQDDRDVVMMTEVDLGSIEVGMSIDPPESVQVEELGDQHTPESQKPRTKSRKHASAHQPFRSGHYDLFDEDESMPYVQSIPKQKETTSKCSKHSSGASTTRQMEPRDLDALEVEIARLIEGFREDIVLYQHFRSLLSMQSLPRTALLSMIHNYLATMRSDRSNAPNIPVDHVLVEPLPMSGIETEDHEALEAEIVQLLEEFQQDSRLYHHFTRLLSLKSLPRTILLSMVQNVLATTCSSRNRHQSLQSSDAEDDASIAKKQIRNGKRAGVRHRSLAKTALAQIVRDEAKQMLQPEGRPLQSATPQEAELFRQGKHLGPTKDNFRLDFISKGPWNVWNKAAADIFVKKLNAVDGCEDLDEELVCGAFRTHLRQLRTQWAHPSNVPKSQGIREQEQLNRREQRRRRTLERRTKAITAYYTENKATMNDAYEASSLLEVDIMSEEDSSDEGGYVIKKQAWRSRELEDFLRYSTALHMSLKRLPDEKYSSGAFPTPRQYVQNAPISTIPAIPELPINFYDASWLNDPQHPERRKLMKAKGRIDLTLPDNVLRQARVFLHVQTRQDLPLPSRAV